MATAMATMIEIVMASGPGRPPPVLLRGAWGGRGPPPPMRPRPNSPAKLSGFPCRDEPVDLLEDSSGVESGDSSSGLVLTILLPV